MLSGGARREAFGLMECSPIETLLRRSAPSPIPQPIRLTKPIKPSPISVPAGSKARQFSCHKCRQFQTWGGDRGHRRFI